MWARPGETWEALPALEKQRAVDAAVEDVVLEEASRRDRRQHLLAASDSHRGMFAGQESELSSSDVPATSTFASDGDAPGPVKSPIKKAVKPAKKSQQPSSGSEAGSPLKRPPSLHVMAQRASALSPGRTCSFGGSPQGGASV
jgi:hypothetical protein